jgi:hypothetical protein
MSRCPCCLSNAGECECSYLSVLLAQAQAGTLGHTGWCDLRELISDLQWKAQEQADIITTLERRLRKAHRAV